MPFVSQVRGRPVYDADGERVGTLKDLVITTDVPYPPVRSLVVGARDGVLAVPWRDVASVTPNGAALRARFTSSAYGPPSEDDELVWLGRDVLDRQIVDTEGAKLVRVNDVALAPLNDEMRVAGVDGSTVGLLRRIGLDRISGALRRRAPQLIDWEQVDIGPALSDFHLRVPYHRLQQMHPADIAHVVSQMSPGEAADVLEALDDETAARAMAELPDEHQAAVLSAMEPEEAADVLEEMEPDEAADVLGDLREDQADELMRLMEPAAARDVRSLLAYPEDTAGGLMDMNVVTVPEDASIAAAIRAVREASAEGDEVPEVYVVDQLGQLAGELRLASLITSPETAPVGMVMLRDVHTVHTGTSDEETARTLVHYGLLSVPVVDDEGRLKGAVRINDVMDLFAPRVWHDRPRQARG
jgi:CBS domain-containing protein